MGCCAGSDAVFPEVFEEGGAACCAAWVAGAVLFCAWVVSRRSHQNGEENQNESQPRPMPSEVQLFDFAANHLYSFYQCRAG